MKNTYQNVKLKKKPQQYKMKYIAWSHRCIKNINRNCLWVMGLERQDPTMGGTQSACPLHFPKSKALLIIFL